MYKKILGFFIFAIITLIHTGSAFAYSSINTDNMNKGVIEINYSASKKTKVMIEHSGEKYFYNLQKNSEKFSLQMGNGKYTIAILEQVEGKKYKVKEKATINFVIETPEQVFLNPVQGMDFESETKVAKLAEKLTADLNSDEEKVEAVYNYLLENIKYDDSKFSTLSKEYIPEAGKIVSSGKGLCYDYASVLGTMLRSIDIPTKLVKGYKNDISVYHAWNEVYLGGNWIVIDASYDANMLENDVNVEMIKKSSSYNSLKVY